VNLVCDDGTVADQRPAARIRYEKADLSVDGFHASDTLNEVTVVARRFVGVVGGVRSFDPNDARSGDISGSTGVVASRHAERIRTTAAIHRIAELMALSWGYRANSLASPGAGRQRTCGERQ
jgi:hypothetical protein